VQNSKYSIVVNAHNIAEITHYSSEAIGWTTEESGCDTAKGQEMFVFKASTPSLRPIRVHSCVQLVTVMVTPRLKGCESELTTYIYLV